MRVVVIVGVDRVGTRGPGSEQGEVFWMLAHRVRRAAATNMVIEADNVVGRRHDDVQIVRNQQHGAVLVASDRVDEVVELGLAVEIDACGGLIED